MHTALSCAKTPSSKMLDPARGISSSESSTFRLSFSPMDDLVKRVPPFKELRLPSLFSDFTELREINPEGFAANVDAWATLLLEGLRSHFFKSSVSIASAGLPLELSLPSHGEPKALALVLEELIKSKKYIPLSIYKDTSPYSARRLADYISPMKWLLATWALMKLSSFKTSSKTGHLVPESYIHIDHLAAVGDKITKLVLLRLDKEGVYSSRLLDDEMFAAVVREVHDHISDSDIEVLYTYISRDAGKMTLVKQNSKSNKIYIKFGTSEAEISEDDISIIKLKSSIQSVALRTALLEHRLDVEIPERIQHLLKLKDSSRQERLKNVLIQKAQVKKSLLKCHLASTQLASVMEAINDAQGNASLYETLQSTKSTLLSLNEKVSLDELDELQVELDEEIAATNTVSDALVVLKDGVDEEEIDDELERLEKEEKAKLGQKKEPSQQSNTPEELQKKLENLNIKDTSPPKQQENKEEKEEIGRAHV